MSVCALGRKLPPVRVAAEAPCSSGGEAPWRQGSEAADALLQWQQQWPGREAAAPTGCLLAAVIAPAKSLLAAAPTGSVLAAVTAPARSLLIAAVTAPSSSINSS